MGPSLSLGSIPTDSGTALPVLNSAEIRGAADEIETYGSGAEIGIGLSDDLIVPGSFTSSYGNTAVTAGNIIRYSEGGKDVYSQVATTVNAGACTAGTVTLVGGAIRIFTISVTAGSLIMLWRQSPGTTGTDVLGELVVTGISPGNSFNILSLIMLNPFITADNDRSVVFWEIVN
jgi:hypothetical protein